MEFKIENKWKLESLRLTSFLRNTFSGNHLESWLTEITQGTVISIIRNANYFRGLVLTESGMVKLEWNSDRIDIVLNSPTPSRETNIGDFSLLAELMKKIPFKFLEIKEWPESRRLAIGVILNASVDSVESGVSVLASNLKYVSGLPGSSDFMYRINKPIQSTFKSDINLNRLMTWSIGEFQLIDVKVNPQRQNLGQQVHSEPPELICRLELDFNTVESPDATLLSPEQLGIANELLNEAVSVSQKGEHGLR